MPARTVVLERLVKYNGEQHAPLTPGEYTQLTGRAGRRGIDVEGHAVVLWHPTTSRPADVAGLASTRTFPLRSSFAPSYNMTINLVQQMGPEQAHQLLERSFAQYQADRSVVGLVRGVARGEKMLDEIAAELGGRDAPILEYARLRAAISERERAQSRASRLQRRKATNDALAGAAPRRHHHHRPGPPRRPGGRARACRRRRRPAAAGAHRTPLGGKDFVGRLHGASAKLGSMTLPKRVEHRQPRVRRDVASALRSAAAGLDVPSAQAQRASGRREPDVDPELAALREQMRSPSRPSRSPTATRWCGPPSGTCASNGTTPRSRRRSPPRPTRWRGRSTGSCVLLTERGFIEPSGDGDLEGDRRRTRCSRGSTARATCWSPSACGSGTWNGLRRRRVGGRGVGGAVRVAGRHARRDTGCRRRDGAAAPGAAPRPAGCGRRSEPTSSGTALPAESRARPGFRRRDPPVGDHRRSGVVAGRLRCRGQRIPVVRRRFRAVVSSGARPARPGAQRRPHTGAADHRETRHRRHSARRRSS